MRFCNTAALFPVTDHATRESKYINNLVDNWRDNKNTYDFLTRIEKKYNINIWFYKPSTEDDVKVEILEKCSNFVKRRKNVRKPAWDEHCALVKNIEVLLKDIILNMQSTGFVIIVLSGLPLNKNMTLMNAAHKPNQRFYAPN